MNIANVKKIITGLLNHKIFFLQNLRFNVNGDLWNLLRVKKQNIAEVKKI